MPLSSFAGPYGREKPTSHIRLRFIYLGGKKDDGNFLNHDTVQYRR